MRTEREGAEGSARVDTIRERFHPENEFGGFTDLDGTIRFYARVQELLPEDGVALDIGCGRGTQDEDPVRVRRQLRILSGQSRKVIGIDPDPAAAENRFIDEFHRLEPNQPWPVADASVDLAIADFVLEHVQDPPAFFAEAARVIKPGGHIGIRTTNARSYLGVASRLVPSRLHAAALRSVQPARRAEDVFPTVYRCNTRKKLRRALEEHGFDAVVYGFEDEPSYLTFSPVAYRFGLLHRRVAPRALLIGLVAWGRRRGASG